MFKVAKRYVIENGDMPILEDYGFKQCGTKSYIYYSTDLDYYVNSETRDLEIYKDDGCGYDSIEICLHLLYTLIKDNIIEWED